MLRVYLRNVAAEGIFLAFPLGKKEKQEAVKLGAGGTVEIGAVTGTLESLRTHLKGMKFLPEPGLPELEFLERHTEGMTEKEKAVFQAALDIENPKSLPEIVNLSCSMDQYTLCAGAVDYESLGRHLLEKEEVLGITNPCPDYEAVGREYAKSHEGSFTEHGYVSRTGEASKPVYDGKHVPVPGYDRSCVIQAFLYSPFYAAGHYASYPISLPASEERLAMAEKNLGIKKLEECKILYIRCPVSELECFLPFSMDVREMNGLALVLAEKGIMEDVGLREKLFAALEAELPEDMAQAREIAERLESYKLLPKNYDTAADYADYYLEKEKICIEDDLQPFFDYAAFGEYRMGQDGVAETEQGLILCEERPIRPYPKELETIRLFSPLKGFLYPYDEEWGGMSDQPEEISAGELCKYEDRILKRIRQERLEKEAERGLAVYLRNRLLKRKVFSMKPTVEVWDGELWGVLEIKSRGSLSRHELSGLMDAWRSQESDGWGEGFEQREINTEEGDIYVRFWNSSDDFFIKTETELKQRRTQDFGMQMGGNG